MKWEFAILSIIGISFLLSLSIIYAETSDSGIEYLGEKEYNIPQWVKNNAGWWSENLISDAEFISGIKFLLENNFMEISSTQITNSNSISIPEWIKYNAGWWSSGQISDSEFIYAINHLIKTNIIRFAPNLDSNSQKS